MHCADSVNLCFTDVFYAGREKSQDPQQMHILGYCRHVVKQHGCLLTGGPVLYMNISAY